MPIKYKELSPQKIYEYFKETFSKGSCYFMKGLVVKDCIEFLKHINDLETEKLNEEQRNEILRNLSNLTVELWGEMLKQALDTLDDADDFKHYDTIRGISRLKQYLTKFKEFEMLLYGSNKWYRDTIYHQLWFFFVGIYLFSHREQNQEQNLMEQLMENRSWYCEPSEEIKDKRKITREKARYAFFCVIALCHDLGKPLQIIHSINKAIRSMLDEYKFLHFNPFKVEFPITYASMLNFLVERLGQIGIPYRLEDSSPFTIRKGVEIDGKKERENESYYIRMEKYKHNEPHMQTTFSTALAELNHGTISCLLLMESFRWFKGAEIYKDWRIDRSKGNFKGIWIQKSYMTAQYILKSIAYHSMESLEIIEIDLPLFWVLLVDDLIEDYRPSRAGKDFISSSMCKVKIKEVSLKKIHICFEFNHPVSKKTNFEDDFINFFIDKLGRYFYMIQLKNFKFIIEVNEIMGGKERFQMCLIYDSIKNQEAPNSVILKSKEDSCTLDHEKIKKLLMQHRKNRIKEIKKFFIEGKESLSEDL